MRQMQTWHVCQFCGAVTSPDHADHWLVQPHKNDWDITIVRCPQHWSEWAMRQTKEGRTKANRQRMKDAAGVAIPVIPPRLSPFPTQEQEAKNHERNHPAAE